MSEQKQNLSSEQEEKNTGSDQMAIQSPTTEPKADKGDKVTETNVKPQGSKVSIKKLAEEKAPKTGPAHVAPKRNKYADKMTKRKGKLGKKVQIAIAACVVVILVALGIFGVLKSREASNKNNEAKIAQVTRGMLETYVEGYGITAAQKREELGKDLKGEVSKVLVEIGDEVKTGDKLLVVDPTETKKELETAEEELAEAQRGVTSAQAEVARAQSEVSAVQSKLGKLTISAPFTGKVMPVTDSDGNSVEFKVGQQINEGDVIGYMVDDSTLQLSLYFSAAYQNSIKAGQSATVSIPSAMSAVSGTVSSVENAQKISNEGVKLFRVVISVKNSGTLTQGMSATATVSANGETITPAESGVLKFGREQAITAQVSGEIVSLNGIDYYNYNSGATIMRLSSDNLQSELKTAQSGVATAQSGVVTAQKQVASKQERIAELKKLIADAAIESPMDGVVVSLNATEGMEVGGTEPLVVVADMNDIIVKADISATDVGSVQPGQPAMMTMYTNDGDLMLSGYVDSVAMEPTQTDNSQGGGVPTFAAVLKIDPVEGQTVSVGQSVDFRITTASSSDCLIVPSSAVVNTEDGTAVFVQTSEDVTFDNTLPIPEGTTGVPEDFVLVPVYIGISDSSNVEIIDGLEEGMVVLLAGPEDLYANMGMESGIAVG